MVHCKSWERRGRTCWRSAARSSCFSVRRMSCSSGSMRKNQRLLMRRSALIWSKWKCCRRSLMISRRYVSHTRLWLIYHWTLALANTCSLILNSCICYCFLGSESKWIAAEGYKQGGIWAGVWRTDGWRGSCYAGPGMKKNTLHSEFG